MPARRGRIRGSVTRRSVGKVGYVNVSRPAHEPQSPLPADRCSHLTFVVQAIATGRGGAERVEPPTRSGLVPRRGGAEIQTPVFSAPRSSARHSCLGFPPAASRAIPTTIPVTRPLGPPGETASMARPADGLRPLPSPPAPRLTGLAGASRSREQAARPSPGSGRRDRGLPRLRRPPRRLHAPALPRLRP